MLLHGKKELSNAELMAILLRSGVPGKTAVDVAKEVLNMAGNRLSVLSQFDYSRLAAVKGVGQAKATTLLAALELGWRLQGEVSLSNDLIVRDSTSLFNYMSPLLADLDHEEFWAVYLSNRNKVLARQRITSGGMTETSVDTRLIFRGALECKAVKTMVLHNHPSGSLMPSTEDRRLTRRLKEAGDIMQIAVIEHLIIAIGPDGRLGFYSFHDQGEL